MTKLFEDHLRYNDVSNFLKNICTTLSEVSNK